MSSNTLVFPPQTPRLRTLEQTRDSLLKAQGETLCGDIERHAELRDHIEMIEEAIREAVDEEDTNHGRQFA